MVAHGHRPIAALRPEALRTGRANMGRMTLVHRVLPPSPYLTLEEYVKAGGGQGLENARAVEPVALIDEIEASGLRGRGGAGFPTGRKWRSVAGFASDVLATMVVVNAAEGEPGTLKDRTILRMNPYEVIEGALIAARAMGARTIVIATKASFAQEIGRLRGAIEEMTAAGWIDDDLELSIFEGSEEYLYGEETGLLEALDGRPPFPRIAPPYRRGVVEVVETDADTTADSGLAAHVEMAGEETDAPPVLVDNVETMANVPKIIARGAAWFRTEGTERSPGTLICTITGSTRRAGVGEVLMGTTLRAAIEEIGGGPEAGQTIKAVLVGASNAVLGPEHLDTPLTYEDMQTIGSGLGSGSYLVYDDRDDMVAVAAGVSRFLAVESCGQCTPCKQDGLEISDRLETICAGNGTTADVSAIDRRLVTVVNGARCNLAQQQQTVVGSLLQRFGDEVRRHVEREVDPVVPELVVDLVDIDEAQQTVVDERFRRKQPDWTYDAVWSGKSPVDLLTDHRAHAPSE
jgi:NADH-quinone oxidoreductase subunit F